MNKKNSLTILCIVLSFISHAQPLCDSKRDYIWKTGYAGEAHDVNFKLMTLDFSTNPINITSVWDSASFYSTNASVCDTLGHLVFYTNGIFVYDKNDRLMTHDTLNPGYYANIHAWGGGYNFYQAALILPLPNNPYKYYLIHQRIADPVPLAHYSDPTDGEGLYYTVIDSRLRNGASGVVSWRNLIVRDTLEHGKVNAVRHANGRDWWITCWHKNYTKYRLSLLDPAGLHDLGWRQVATFLSASQFGQSCFSPDGSLFAATTYDTLSRKSRIDILDFDRCTGLLSNRRQFLNAAAGYYIGASISPNSRYFYISNGYRILQYDLQAPDIFSTNDTVATGDLTFFDSTFVGNPPTPIGFWAHQLGPDGKIYISSNNSTKYLHVIANPDEQGAACNVLVHSIHLPALAFRAIPNFPNFRLGPVDGSVCDTLGFNAVNSPAHAPPETGGFIKVVPNPAANELTIQYSNFQNKQLIITDVLGRPQKSVPLESEETTVNIQNFSNGIYYVSIYENNRLLGSCKLVVLRE